MLRGVGMIARGRGISLNLENVTQKRVLDTHSQRAATEHETEDILVGDDGGSHQSVIAEAIRYIERKQNGRAGISGQCGQFATVNFRPVVLNCVVRWKSSSILSSRWSRRQAFDAAIDLQRIEISCLRRRSRPKCCRSSCALTSDRASPLPR